MSDINGGSISIFFRFVKEFELAMTHHEGMHMSCLIFKNEWRGKYDAAYLNQEYAAAYWNQKYAAAYWNQKYAACRARNKYQSWQMIRWRANKRVSSADQGTAVGKAEELPSCF